MAGTWTGASATCCASRSATGSAATCCERPATCPTCSGCAPGGAATASTVREHLPRIKRDELLALLGVRSLGPIDGALVNLVEAALAASALPSLDGSSREVLVARRAALEVIGRRLPVRESARLLGTGERMLFRLRQRPVDAALVQAIRLQLHLIEQRGSEPVGVFAEAG